MRLADVIDLNVEASIVDVICVEHLGDNCKVISRWINTFEVLIVRSRRVSTCASLFLLAVRER